MKVLILALSITIAIAAPQVKPRRKVAPLSHTSPPSTPVPVPSHNQHESQSHYEQGSDAQAVILKSESDVAPDGYVFSYETANGITGEAQGEIAKSDQVDFIKVKGQYSYVDPEGTKVLVSYTADEHGYHPQGDVLPVAPPVPPAIARSLEYIAQHPPYDAETAKKHK